MAADARPPAPLPPPCVIVVDDDAAVRNAISFSLSTEGFDVRTFATGEALLADPASPADAYVIDEKLANGMTGTELLVELRANRVTAPVILMTTHPGPELQRRAARLGAPIIEKPLMGATLAELLRGSVSRQGGAG